MNNQTRPIQDETRRVEALRSYGVLDTPDEAAFDDLTRLASMWCDTPVALVSLVDERRQWFKSRVGLDIMETPKDQSFCAHTIQGSGLMIVSDALEDGRFSANPLVTGGPGIRFYAGAPLVNPEGFALGTLCVIDRKPRELTASQLEALQALSRQVAALLELRRRLNEVADREHRLEVSQARFRTLFETAPVGMLILSSETGAVLEGNDVAAELLGLKVDRLAGVQLSKFANGAAAARLNTHLREVASKGGHRVELSLKTGPERTLDVWLSTRLIRLDGHESMITVMIDVTDRRRKEAQLNEKTAVLEAIMNTSVAAITRLDLSGRIIYANPRAEEVLGLRRDELFTRKFNSPDWRITAPDGSPIPEERLPFRRVLDTGRPVFNVEHAIERPDGQRRRLSVNGAPIKDEKGRITSLVFSVRDVTDRHAAEEALARNERRYRAIVEDQTEFIVRWLPDGTRTFVNDAYVRYFGQSREELVGSNFFRLISDEQRETVRERLTTITPTTPVVMNFHQGRRVDGEWRWQQWIDRGLFDRHGRLIELQSVGRDVHEQVVAEMALRASEERFRQLAENIDEVFWSTSPDRREVYYISPAFEKVWGVPPARLHENPGLWAESIHPEDRDRVLNPPPNFDSGGEQEQTYRIVRFDGGVRWIRDRAFPIRDVDGAVHRIVGVAEDITDRHRLEEELRNSRKLEAIGRMAAGIAHDFNNIIGIVLGNTGLAKLDLPAGHPAAECVSEIEKAGQRAKHLVQQILTFSRQRSPERQIVDARSVVGETVAMLRGTIPEKVALECELPKQPMPILADSTQLQQALFNLCLNSWHAMEQGPGRIVVRLARLEPGEGKTRDPAGLKPVPHVELTVSDDGRGMDAVTLERAFEPFFTTKPPGKGTGLGLSVVHGIVKNHDGSVDVRSEPGLGATFRLLFPAADRDPVDAQSVADRVPLCGAGQRVLFVDDEEGLVFPARRALQQLGFEVLAFTDPRAALRAVEDDPRRFDIVVTDYNMPDFSGLQFVEAVQAVRPDLMVIMCSGYINDELKERASGAGIGELIYKPYTVADLTAALWRSMQATASVRENPDDSD